MVNVPTQGQRSEASAARSLCGEMAAAGPLARDTTAVFVYGTLKRGSFNHHILRRCLENAGPTHQAVYTAASAASGSAQGRNHLGTAFETVQRYPLVLKPARHVPALIPQPGAGHHVTGEVYYCDAEALELLDELEEVATLKYTRQAVVVRPQAPQAASAELECQAYFISEEEAERSGLPPASKCASLGPAECLRSYIDPRYVFRSGRAERTSQRSASGISAPRCVVFCDFDGTISVTDTLDVLIDAAMGEEARERIDQQYADGEISFRCDDGFLSTQFCRCLNALSFRQGDDDNLCCIILIMHYDDDRVLYTCHTIWNARIIWRVCVA